MPTVRVALPYHLRRLAGVGAEVQVEIAGAPTLGAVLDALESLYPVLRGTIRDQASKQRRPFVRFYACKADYSHEPPATALPAPIASGQEPLLIIGAMSGG